ncbi:MAG: VanZ family protein [Proteobacteria bacterium]|nr:VanZ family protein [Pseudomonadota bacterium]
MTIERPGSPGGDSAPSTPAASLQPAWLTGLARVLLGAAVALVAVAVLLPNTRLAALRLHWSWFSEAINRVEALWPTVDMVHVVMFGAVGVLLALAYPAARPVRLLLAIVALAAVSELVQLWVPGRTASVGEAMLDVAAAGVGLLLVAGVRRLTGSPVRRMDQSMHG